MGAQGARSAHNTPQEGGSSARKCAPGLERVGTRMRVLDARGVDNTPSCGYARYLEEHADRCGDARSRLPITHVAHAQRRAASVLL